MKERSKSLWMDKAPASAPALSSNIEADVVVVGAGIAGLSVAYELCRRGRSVVVLDREDIGRGMTARTTAHLASEFDDFYHHLIDMHGEETARAVFESEAAAIDRIEAIIKEESIDCAFQRLNGYLCLSPECEESLLDRELEACRTIGFPGIERVAKAPMRGAGPALRFPNQGRFHPLRYLDGLADALRRRGARLFARTCVTAVEEAGDVVTVRTSKGVHVKAAAAVVATNGPINDRVKLHAKMAPYRTFAIAGEVPAGSVEDALFWDTSDPYHYVRLHQQGEKSFLVIGGEDHKTGNEDDAEVRFERLEGWARSKFPTFGRVQFRWSGQVMEPVDAVGLIGRYPGNENIYVATGDSGQGMTHGALAGLLISDLVTAGHANWAEAYDPARKPTRSIGEFISENLTAVASMAEHLVGLEEEPREVDSEDDIPPGRGAIVRSGSQKVAAFRDENGVIHRCSATCTHAGCVVHWNSFERCWDCPCHGSHFAIDGTVLNGPAVEPLEGAKSPAAKEKASS